MHKKILVVGGAGYVGSRLVPKLIELGHDITVVDLLWFGNKLDRNVRVIKKDLMKLDLKFISKFDQVIFLAGLSNDPMANYSPQMNYICNVAHPAYLSYIAKLSGVKRFIYASTSSVYGNSKKPGREIELHPQATYPYGLSKYLGERAVMHLCDDKFSVICLRKGTIGGWSPRMRFDLLVNGLFMSAINNRKIVITNPKIWRPILAISDAVDAYTKAVDAPNHISGVFNTFSENLTLLQAAKITKDFFKSILDMDVKIEIQNQQDPRSYILAEGEIADKLKFTAKENLNSILNELLEKIPLNTEFGSDKYYNINMFKKIIHVYYFKLNN